MSRQEEIVSFSSVGKSFAKYAIAFCIIEIFTEGYILTALKDEIVTCSFVRNLQRMVSFRWLDCTIVKRDTLILYLVKKL
jgi:hypothetical protein